MAITLLTSCNTQQKIRSDIANFIASFSLEEAVKEYLDAGYINTKNITFPDHNEKEVDAIEFNVTDASNPKYHHQNIKYVDDVKETSLNEDFLYQDNKFYLSSSCEKRKENVDDIDYDISTEIEEKTLNECHNIIQNFFYKQIVFDNYYWYGNYYGDYVYWTLPDLQNFVTIDEDNELYIFSSMSQRKNSDDEIVTSIETYKVNKVGMLYTLDLEMYTDDTRLVQHIEVYKN